MTLFFLSTFSKSEVPKHLDSGSIQPSVTSDWPSISLSICPSREHSVCVCFIGFHGDEEDDQILIDRCCESVLGEK